MKRTQVLGASLLLSIAATTTACDPNGAAAPSEPQSEADQDLRDSSRFEAYADLNQVVTALRALYGPLIRKEQRYQFDLDAAVAGARIEMAASRNDGDTFRVIQHLLDRLNDAHVSYSASVLADSARQIKLPLLVEPVESKFLVAGIGAALRGQVAIGDELLQIDGRTPHELIRQFARVEGVPNPKTEAQFAAADITFRSFFLPKKFLPAPGSTAVLQLARADGSTYQVSATWVSNRPPPRLAPPPHAGSALRRPYALAGDAIQDLLRARHDQASVLDFAGNAPFFWTQAVQQTFGITPVRPSDATMQKFQVPLCDGSKSFDCYQSFAGTYTYQGKRVLLARIPSYVPSTAPGSGFDSTYLKALLSDFQGSSDVLVLDETNNPGGSVGTALDILSSLITQPAINAGFALHADRKSINDLRSGADELAGLGPDFAGLAAKFNAGADALERAYDQKQPLGPLFPLVPFDPTGADDRVLPDPGVQWAKPFVVLTNELSFSGGDLFPMLVKANHLAPTFGETTAGAGGNVEEVLTTSFSQGSLHLTRSIFAPMTDDAQIPFGTVVEDQGVSPDAPHPITVADFRAGFVGYVKAFSDLAVRQTR